jgi:hypothetical protein
MRFKARHRYWKGLDDAKMLLSPCVIAVMAVGGLPGRAQSVGLATLYGAGIVGCFPIIGRGIGFTGGIA